MSVVENRRNVRSSLKVKTSILKKKILRISVLSLCHKLKTDIRKFFFFKILVLAFIKNSDFWRFSTALIDDSAVICSKKYPYHLYMARTILWILSILNWPFASASLPKKWTLIRVLLLCRGQFSHYTFVVYGQFHWIFELEVLGCWHRSGVVMMFNFQSVACSAQSIGQ